MNQVSNFKPSIIKAAVPTNRVIHRLSKIFQPVSSVPKDADIKNQDITSNSQKLMLELGIIRTANPGSFHLLPLGVRSLEKLIKLIDKEMLKIGAQKVIFPTLTSAKLWEKSGRLKDVESELFSLKDRHNRKYILSPTHEEAASDLLSTLAPLSYKQFPLKLYQITNKFRDEMKPRFGLMRERQFLMKDLYTFDVDFDSASNTYEAVCESYDNVFNKIGIDYVKVLGESGKMGGTVSHEYHYIADVGEDKILTCIGCSYAANTQVSGEEKCPKCNKTDGLQFSTGIEVGHTFLLGDRYSKPLNAMYLSQNAKPHSLQMGSYGLGLTRILAAAVEVLATEQEIRWPFALAPFSVIIIPPKYGSKEEEHTKHLSEKLYNYLETIAPLRDNVLLDDRASLTIGRRLLEARRVGYPYIVAIGKKATEDPPLYELYEINSNKHMYFTEVELLNYMKENVLR